MSRVYIVLLNWNNWPDTLECLESLLRLDYSDCRIVICDNGSTDSSVDRIFDWASGQLDVLSSRAGLYGQALPAVKPVLVSEYDRRTAEQGGGSNDSSLVLIRNGENLGFAGGCNVGLRYVQAKNDADYIWILNNDTIVDPAALHMLVDRMRACPAAGICGSTILDYWYPQRVDALGGASYCRWLGLAWHLGRWRKLPGEIIPEDFERRMDYVVGASMFVSARFLREVGFLEESYFLYYEELDWAMRSKGRFTLAYAPNSLVFHKVGGSIGTSTHPTKKSLMADFYTLRNRLKFTRKYCPYALPTIYVGLLVSIAIRLAFAQGRKSLMVFRLLLNPHVSYEKCAVDR